MLRLLPLAVFLAAALTVSAQKTNDAIQEQIKSLKADKQITLSYDSAANASKVMAAAGNFADGDAKKAGIQAMNFGMAFFYAGRSLTASPDPINLTFWVLAKKPQFALSHKWTMAGVELGEARYAAKAGEDMEYLNFKVVRSDLAKVAASDGKFKLGEANFTFTSEQLQLMRSILAVSNLP